MNNWTKVSENKKEDTPSTEVVFEDIDTASKKRGLKVLAYGRPGSGKTDFSLSAPGPIYVLDTEMGSSALKYRYEGKDIKILNLFSLNPEDGYIKTKEAVSTLMGLIEQGKVGTVVIDSLTDLWEFSQDYAKTTIWKIKTTDRLKQQWDWGVINKLYYKLLKPLLLSNINLVFTARAAEEYAAAGQPTGVEKPKTQKDTPHWVDIIVQMQNKRTVGQNNFVSIVEKSRLKGELTGKVINDLNFDKLKKELEV